jgi:uncharacterized membrane protein YkoI
LITVIVLTLRNTYIVYSIASKQSQIREDTMFNRLTLAASAVAVAALVAGAAAPASAGHERREHAHEKPAHDTHHHHKRHGKESSKHVEHALHAMGFVSWDEIELDDGLWEVDDARRADGSQWDIKLDPNTLAVVKRKQERKAHAR